MKSSNPTSLRDLTSLGKHLEDPIFPPPSPHADLQLARHQLPRALGQGPRRPLRQDGAQATRLPAHAADVGRRPVGAHAAVLPAQAEAHQGTKQV